MRVRMTRGESGFLRGGGASSTEPTRESLVWTAAFLSILSCPVLFRNRVCSPSLDHIRPKKPREWVCPSFHTSGATARCWGGATWQSCREARVTRLNTWLLNLSCCPPLPTPVAPSYRGGFKNKSKAIYFPAEGPGESADWLDGSAHVLGVDPFCRSLLQEVTSLRMNPEGPSLPTALEWEQPASEHAHATWTSFNNKPVILWRHLLGSAYFL